MAAGDPDLPWIVYSFLTSARMTRFTGRRHVEMTCAVCGVHELRILRIPRFAEIPEPDSRHLVLVEYKLLHLHKERPDPVFWAQPFMVSAERRRLPSLEQLEDLELELDMIVLGARSDQIGEP